MFKSRFQLQKRRRPCPSALFPLLKALWLPRGRDRAVIETLEILLLQHLFIPGLSVYNGNNYKQNKKTDAGGSNMLNRVIVNIDDFDYTVVSEDPEDYIRKNAALVDQTIREIKASTPFSAMTSAVLAAMNLSDKYYKAQDSADGLRVQIKDYAEECARLRAEVARLNKELKEAKR